MFSQITKIFSSLKKMGALRSASQDRIREEGTYFLRQGAWEKAAESYKCLIDLTPDSAELYVNLGFALKELKRYEEAGSNLNSALAIDPNSADANYILGSICQENDDLPGAVAYLEKAILLQPTLDVAYCDLCVIFFRLGQKEQAKKILLKGIARAPEHADFYYFFGNLHYFDKQIDQALDCYRKALTLRPDYTEALYNLANVLREQGDLDSAKNYYRRAVVASPKFIDAYIVLGDILLEKEIYNEAKTCFEKILELDPLHKNTYLKLGNLSVTLGNHEAAAANYEKFRELDPASEGISQLIAALKGVTPDKAPGQYAERLFDGYAERFDTELVEKLQYIVPEKLLEAIFQTVPAPVEKWDALDLGCGTGLLGRKLAPYVNNLVGVDLSGKMLEKTRALNLYQRLEQSDLLLMMRAEKAASYDLIVSADVFIYVGALDDVFVEAKRLLRPGGLFAFSVEALESVSDEGSIERKKGFRLNPTARYAHAADYLLQLAHQNGFIDKKMNLSPLRNNGGTPIEGWIAVLQLDQ